MLYTAPLAEASISARMDEDWRPTAIGCTRGKLSFVSPGICELQEQHEPFGQACSLLIPFLGKRKDRWCGLRMAAQAPNLGDITGEISLSPGLHYRRHHALDRLGTVALHHMHHPSSPTSRGFCPTRATVVVSQTTYTCRSKDQQRRRSLAATHSLGEQQGEWDALPNSRVRLALNIICRTIHDASHPPAADWTTKPAARSNDRRVSPGTIAFFRIACACSPPSITAGTRSIGGRDTEEETSCT